ncbi:unnamed protein product [Caenorhabditis bovis]|uniref:Uncharacterized protein n=1 Tax=Caenorhabditis bovis TaxID=2654633 RepID=A0A8S1EZ23_9PELO|nr:unnamed protein product [Caenorhabditis bovis]
MEDSRRSTDPPKEIAGRSCAVCSDKANGYNFGVLSCESCKAFFRRNAAKRKEIKCPFSNSCEITSASRKFCQACRLNKCISVGMNSEWLIEGKNKVGKIKRKRNESPGSTVEKEDDENVTIPKAFLQKLMKNAKAPSSCSCSCTCGFYPVGTKLVAAPQTPTPSSFDKYSAVNSPSSIIGYSPMASTRPANSPIVPFPIQCSPQPSRTSVVPSFTAPQDCAKKSVIKENTFVDDGVLQEIRRKIDKYRGVLSIDEMALLEELHVLNEPLKYPLEKNYNQESLQGVVQIVQEALRRIISMTAQLKAFRELGYEDRRQLVKSGFCELLIVRGIMAYNKTNATWNHKFATNNMEVKLDVLKQDPKYVAHYKVHKKLLDSFSDEIRTNESIMLIFNAIVIFHPRVSDLKESHKVHQTQAAYFKMLLSVLNFEFSEEKANDCYKKLLDLVVDLHMANQTMLHVFYGFDPARLDPLVKELCDFT